MTFRTFLNECHTRDVFKKLSLYVVFSWVVIQVLAATWDPLGLPKRSVTYLILTLLIGLPLYTFYIGKFEINELKDAHLEDDIVTEEEQSTLKMFKRLFYSGVGLMSTISGLGVYLIVSNSFGAESKSLVINVSDKIAVLSFDNNTGSDKYDVISEMAADWIIQGITENNIGKVVSPEILDSYKGSLSQSLGLEQPSNILKNVIHPKTIISGNFYLQGDNLIFKGSILDGQSEEILISFDPVSCNESNALECIESLQQDILGYFVTSENKALNLQQKPPKFDAWQSVILAKEVYALDTTKYLEQLNNAIQIDPEYFEPKVLRIAHYYNLGKYKIADSLLEGITLSRNNNRQRNLLRMYAALLKGENNQTYRYLLEEYKLAPFDIQSNSSAMVIAQQFVNKPQDIDSLFMEIPMNQMDIENCGFCQSRILIKAQSELSLGNYDAIFKLPYDKKYYKESYMTALVKTGDIKALDGYLSSESLTKSQSEIDKTLYFAGKQLLLVNHIENPSYFKKLLTTSTNLEITADALIWLEDYNQAKIKLDLAITANPENESLLAKMAIVGTKLKDEPLTKKMLKRLNELKQPYQYGSVDYAFAQYYAAIENESLMYDYLRRSISEGKFYTMHSFQNDPYFKKYKDSDKFKAILTYWH